MNNSSLAIIIDKNDRQEWDNLLSQFVERNIFQSYAWGELKKNENWNCSRIIILNDKAPVLIAQILIKEFFGIKFAWCPGGPILNTNNLSISKLALNEFKKTIISKNIFNLRCRPYMEKNEKNLELFSSLAKSSIKVTSSKTINIATQDEDIFLKECKRKHRYYIRQSQKNDLEWKITTYDEAENIFKKVLNEMQITKKVNIKLIDINNFARLLETKKSNHPQVFALTGFEKQYPVASCIMSIFDGIAFHHYAASNERGREIFASYGMTYELIKVLKNMNVQFMNFGSISDDNSSPGVDHFKLGFGGVLYERVGEFDIAKFKIYSYAFNKILQFRKYKE